VQELGGMLFAYLGPAPAPLLPRWDVLARDDLDAVVVVNKLPCNWLQCMDNAADPVHFEYLHAALGNYALKRQGKPPNMTQAKHLKIEFDRFEYGIMKRRLLEGESEDCDDWTTGHPLLFPNTLAVGDQGHPTLQFRVPVDDENTIQFAYRTSIRPAGAARKPIIVKHVELFGKDGRITPDNVPFQDMLAWVMQGPISDRENEQLSLSDKGVILYHRMLNEEMDKVARGEDPLGLIRDKAINEPMINLRREKAALQSFDTKYERTFDRVSKTAAE
jgi:5,5'-dehydrodivanillate O-demethylase